MSESEGKSPYGPGFVAACIVVGAVLVCGIALVVTGGSTGGAGTTSAGSDGGSSNAVAGQPGADEVARRETPSQPEPAPASPSAVVGGGRTETDRSANSCGLDDGDQGIPSQAPPVDGWEVSHRVVVPRSAAFGPAKTDADGFRRCFAHSPTGALYAAYNAVAALADQSQAIPTVKKLMLPGANTEALLQELRRQPASDSAASQVAGFRILDAGHDRATIMLAIPVESEYMSVTFTMVWYAGDWRMQPPQPGNPVGAPFSQHRHLGDFVAWSGV